MSTEMRFDGPDYDLSEMRVKFADHIRIERRRRVSWLLLTFAIGFASCWLLLGLR